MNTTNLDERIMRRFPAVGDELTRSQLYRSIHKANSEALDDALDALIDDGRLTVQSTHDGRDMRSRAILYRRAR